MELEDCAFSLSTKTVPLVLDILILALHYAHCLPVEAEGSEAGVEGVNLALVAGNYSDLLPVFQVFGVDLDSPVLIHVSDEPVDEIALLGEVVLERQAQQKFLTSSGGTSRTDSGSEDSSGW